MKSAGNNSFYSFCGQNCKNPFLLFFCGPAEKEIPCGRAGQLPAAGAAGNGYASERCSIPRCSAKPGGGRRADAAKEVRFPFFHAASSAAARSADACGFSRIGCSIPLNQEDGVNRPGGASSGHYVYRSGCGAMENGVAMITDGRKKEIAYKRRHCFLADRIKRFNRVIPDGEVGKRRGSAGNRWVKSLSPKIPLRAVYADRRNPGDGFAEIESVGALKG